MKKLLALLLSVSALTAIAGCSDEPELEFDDTENQYDETTPTNYETVQQFIDEFTLPDEILKNVYLPKIIGETGTIIWSSSNSNVLSSGGAVNRPEQQETIELSALITLGGTKHRFNYTANVGALPNTREGKLQEAIDDFYLTQEDANGNIYVDRDVLVLPRVTDLYNVYIDWSSTDESIIDLEGNVHRTEQAQTVTLTATFKYYEYEKNVDYDYDAVEAVETVSKDFVVNVYPTSADSAETIDLDHPQILNVVEVTDVISLYGALYDPQPGDAIVLKDGFYPAFQHTITSSGTAENPIFIFAENPGKVTMTGVTQFDVEGDHVTIANLVFNDGSPLTDMGVIILDGHYNRVTNCLIDSFEKEGNGYKWISLIGSHHEIDRNHFTNKSTSGSLLTIWREDMETQYHHVHQNFFDEFNDTGGNNGYETIRIGTSDYSQTDSNVLVENNYFREMNGEIEIISIKSGRTVIRNNTFESCLGLVTFRHGKNNVADSNIFYGEGETEAGGVRMYDGGHVVRNNFMHDVGGNTSTRAGIVVHTGVNEPNTFAILNLQWTSYNILIENNTIFDAGHGILFCAGYTYGSDDTFIYNNVFVNASGNCITQQTTGANAPTNVTLEGNRFYCSSATATVSAAGDLRDATANQYVGTAASTNSFEMSTSVKVFTQVDPSGQVGSVGLQNNYTISQVGVSYNYWG